MFDYVIPFFMLCLVLYLAYYATKMLGKQMQFKATSKYMEVLDKIYIDRDKVILIVKIQHEYKVLAMSNNAITDIGRLDDLDETAVNEEEPKISFSDLYSKYKKVQSLRTQKFRKSNHESSEMRDEDDA